MTFAGVANHARLTLVCWVVVFDMGHDNHPMMTVTSGTWLYEGLVDAGYDSHTFLQGCLTQQFQVPKVCACDKTLRLHPSTPMWANLPSLVDLCSELGGLSQGAIAAGWVVAVAVDHCLQMVGLYEQACDAPVICDDFGDLAVLPDIWKQSYGASSLLSGFSSQPFSRFGGGRGLHDERACGLPTTLAAAYYLQSWIIVLDCVSPAGADASANSNVMWCTGNPGPVYSGSWQDGCAVPHLHLGGFGLKQRTTWFIKVLKQSLRHRFVRLSLGSGRPHSHLFLFHPGILFLLWLAALDALDRWLSSFSNGTFQRHLQAMDSFPATSCVQLPVVPLTTG